MTAIIIVSIGVVLLLGALTLIGMALAGSNRRSKRRDRSER